MTAVVQAASKFADDQLGKLKVSETSTRPRESDTETMKAVVYLVRLAVSNTQQRKIFNFACYNHARVLGSCL